MNYQELLATNLNPLWSPPPDLLPSQWADKYRMLSPEASAVPGRWRNRKIPFVAGILDAIAEPDIDTLVIKSAAQMVKTEILLNLIGYFVDLDPCPIMLVQPTIDMGESFSRERLAPMIRDTPRLTPLIAPPGSKTSGNTILKKSFPGGQIIVAGANSTASLSSRPIRILLGDEIDRWPLSLGNDGDTLKQAEKRTDAFYNRLKIYVSTPTKKGESRIDSLAELSDKRECYVPCPSCDHMQPLRWENLRWENRDPDTVYYLCRACEEHITDNYKPEMLAKYSWRKTAESRNIAGFVELNSLYSPWQSWSNMVVAWLEAQDMPEQLKAFVNLYLAQCWEEQSEQMAEGDLTTRAEQFGRGRELEDTLFYTAGADIQGDRIECTISGWNVRQGMQVYETVIFPGDTACEPEAVGEDIPGLINPYRKMAEHIAEYYGAKLPQLCLDSGFNTEFAHKNLARYFPEGLATATKGIAGPGHPVISDIRYSGAYKSPWRLVGVDGVKDAIQARLLANNGSIRFSDTLPPEWYDQLTAEKVFSSKRKGFTVREWRKTRKRNEALDCVLLSWAAVYILRPDWAILEANRTARDAPESPPLAPRPRPDGSSRNFATDWR